MRGEDKLRRATLFSGQVDCSPQMTCLHCSYEVANVVRRRWAAQLLTQGQAELALDSFAQLEIDLWPQSLLAEQVWALRGQLGAYDAAYVALAGLLDAPLLTADAKLFQACQQASPQSVVELV